MEENQTFSPFPFENTAAKIGMCNSDQVLSRDSTDQSRKPWSWNFLSFSDWLLQHFVQHPELWLFSLLQHAVQNIDVLVNLFF